MAIFYHGTSANNARSILKSGLIPKAGKGGDAWALMHPAMGKIHKNYARDHSVYLTPVLDEAFDFAFITAQINKSKPAILKVELSKDEAAKLVTDENAEKFAFRYMGTIPPTAIKKLPAKAYAKLKPGDFYTDPEDFIDDRDPLSSLLQSLGGLG